MLLAAVADLILAARIEFAVERPAGIGMVMARQRLGGNDVQADALDARRSPREIPVHDVAVEADGLKYLSSAIALHGGDAHLGHGLHDSLDGGLDEFLNGLLKVGGREQALMDEVGDGLVGEIGVDSAAAVADEQGEMMNLARLAGFQDQSDAAARASADEMMMQAGGGQQGWEGREFRRDAPVG